MDKLGVLASDLSAFYVVKDLRARRADMNIDLIYDPIDYFMAKDQIRLDEYLDKNIGRFKDLDIHEPLLLWEGWRRDLPHWNGFVDQVQKGLDGRKTIQLRSHGQGDVLESPLFFRTAQDGIMQRNFSLAILGEYLASYQGDYEAMILASPSYGHWAGFISDWGRGHSLKVYDPIERILDHCKKISPGQGRLRLYWLDRDYGLEERVREILGYKVKFSTFYSHPWLRGEGLKKRPSFRERLEKLKEEQKKTSDQ